MVENPRLVKVDDGMSARAPGFSVPASRPKITAGRVDRASISRISGPSRCGKSRRAAAASVSRPIAPSAASAKGRRLVSTSWGSWDETMISIVQSASASTIATRSSSCAKAARSLKKVLYSPMSFSFRVRWLIEIPQVTWWPFSAGDANGLRRFGNGDFGCVIGARVRPAMRRSRSSGMISASRGTPGGRATRQQPFIHDALAPRYLSRVSSATTAPNSRA